MTDQISVADSAQQNPLITQPIAVLIRRIGIPVSIGAFFNTMFNVVDTYYGGLISDEALAALSLSFPIFFIIIALGFGLSSGNAALIGNALGEQNRALAERYAVQGLGLGIVLSFLVTYIGLTFSPFLFSVLGASDRYLAISLSYINPIFYGTVFFVIVQMLNSVLNAVGHTRPNRDFLIFGFLFNLILDPWFIYGGFGLPPLGIMGIALATVLVQALGCLYLSYHVAQTKMMTWKSLGRYIWPQPALISQIARQGFPNIIDLSSISIGFFILTYFVSRFGQGAVAAFGAASRIEQVVMLPLIGVDVATLSLIAQNNGAGFVQRVRDTLHTSIRYGLLLMFIGASLITIFAPQLMSLFSDNLEVISIGIVYIRIRAWTLLPIAFIFVSIAAMRGVKKPLHALILSLFRMVILPAIAVYILVELLGFGLIAIWWTTFVIAFLAAGVAYLYAKRLVG